MKHETNWRLFSEPNWNAEKKKISCFCIEPGINSHYRLEKFLLTCPNVELLVSYSHKQEICYDLTVQANYSLSTHASICVKGDTIK